MSTDLHEQYREHRDHDDDLDHDHVDHDGKNELFGFGWKFFCAVIVPS